jgi:hypothetical protein
MLRRSNGFVNQPLSVLLELRLITEAEYNGLIIIRKAPPVAGLPFAIQQDIA